MPIADSSFSAARDEPSRLSRNDSVEFRFDRYNESTERWSELTASRYGLVALADRGLGLSRVTYIAPRRVSGINDRTRRCIHAVLVSVFVALACPLLAAAAKDAKKPTTPVGKPTIKVNSTPVADG